ncbi:5-dehydro-4-deoxyglucarate dehydratase [Kitasatospora sp. NPDC049285]|uniref:5-dehydro-4-deoxyglucarate dehydratase n=1 Tax=Kitasatospora sp. NPDC049285 TaxID=3157096 RepID=UPI0034469BC3
MPGLLSFPLTPFTADDRLDLDVFAEHLERQIAAGPAALYVACGTGEFTALAPDEYRQVVAAAVKAADGRLPVIAGCGGGPQIAREFARAAADCGADGLLLLPPYLTASTPRGLVGHVRYVAAATPLPLTVYQRANAVLDEAAVLDLLDLPTVAGVKDGRGDVDAMLRLVTAVRSSGHPRAEEFGFLNGLPTAELSAQAYRAIGVPSYSSAVHCFAPDLATAFHRALHADDHHAVRLLLAEFYLPFAALRDQVPGYAVALVKAGARLSGLAMGPVRPPLVDATPDHERQLEALVARGRTALAVLAAREA